MAQDASQSASFPFTIRRDATAFVFDTRGFAVSDQVLGAGLSEGQAFLFDFAGTYNSEVGFRSVGPGALAR